MSQDKIGDEIELRLRKKLVSDLELIIDRRCVGCVLVCLADAVARFCCPEDRKERMIQAEEIRDFARNFRGRTMYCGTTKHDLWKIKRHKAHALTIPWVTHEPLCLVDDQNWKEIRRKDDE